MVRRRRKWTVEEWEAFAARARAARDDTDGILVMIDRAAGLRARHVDAVLKLSDRIHSAMVGFESVLIAQHPELEPRVIDFFQDPAGPGRGPCLLGGRSPRVLDRAEWTAVGDRSKRVAAALQSLLALEDTAPKAKLGRILTAVRACTMARAHLENLLRRQHPDWADASHVFFGEPSTAPIPDRIRRLLTTVPCAPRSLDHAH